MLGGCFAGCGSSAGCSSTSDVLGAMGAAVALDAVVVMGAAPLPASCKQLSILFSLGVLRWTQLVRGKWIKSVLVTAFFRAVESVVAKNPAKSCVRDRFVCEVELGVATHHHKKGAKGAIDGKGCDRWQRVR
eukprot:360534-Chlamydomonas_euryale.AAC.2